MAAGRFRWKKNRDIMKYRMTTDLSVRRNTVDSGISRTVVGVTIRAFQRIEKATLRF